MGGEPRRAVANEKARGRPRLLWLRPCWLRAPPPALPFAAMAAAEQEQQHFYLLLGNLLSPDNAVRKQAEVPPAGRPGGAGRAGKGRAGQEGGGWEAAEPHV